MSLLSTTRYSHNYYCNCYYYYYSHYYYYYYYSTTATTTTPTTTITTYSIDGDLVNCEQFSVFKIIGITFAIFAVHQHTKCSMQYAVYAGYCTAKEH